MRYILLLSKEDINLSKEEALSLTKNKKYELIDNLLIIDSDKKEIDFLSKRLAMTKKIYRILFECNKEDWIKQIEKFDWNKIYEKDYSVRITNNGNNILSEKDISSIIWRKLKKPKVNLKDAKTHINIFLKQKTYICLLEKEINNSFDLRKSHNRPESHPSSLSPKLAKTLINLTGIKKGRLVDSMCGSGGILIEAGLMTLTPIGYDIDQIMLNRAKINLDYFNIKKYELKRRDALKLNRKIDYLVVDLPYGKNTKQKELKELYSGFIANLKHTLTRKAVVIFPYFNGKKNINYNSLIKNNKLKIISRFEYYLHKSLSKRIYVIEK